MTGHVWWSEKECSTTVAYDYETTVMEDDARFLFKITAASIEEINAIMDAFHDGDGIRKFLRAENESE